MPERSPISKYLSILYLKKVMLWPNLTPVISKVTNIIWIGVNTFKMKNSMCHNQLVSRFGTVTRNPTVNAHLILYTFKFTVSVGIWLKKRGVMCGSVHRDKFVIKAFPVICLCYKDVWTQHSYFSLSHIWSNSQVKVFFPLGELNKYLFTHFELKIRGKALTLNWTLTFK